MKPPRLNPFVRYATEHQFNALLVIMWSLTFLGESWTLGMFAFVTTVYLLTKFLYGKEIW